MTLPPRGPAHHALEALIGDWIGEEELAPSPWSPDTTAAATLTFRGALAGFAVLQDYRPHRADGNEFFAHGVFTADIRMGDATELTPFLRGRYRRQSR